MPRATPHLAQGFDVAALERLEPAVRMRLYLRIARVCRTHRAHGSRREAAALAWDARRELRG